MVVYSPILYMGGCCGYGAGQGAETADIRPVLFATEYAPGDACVKSICEMKT
jgi:hypothetical protein